MDAPSFTLHRQRPSLSIAMPPAVFDSPKDSLMPRTPIQPDTEQDTMNAPPPPPQRQPFRVRRRRGTLPMQEPDLFADTAIIPTIEMSEVTSELSSPLLKPTPNNNSGLLSPMHFHRLGSEPKTPAPRLGAAFVSPCTSPANEWSLINDSCDPQRLHRAGSTCSSFSDSSVSSCGSSAFSAPNGGSCASPASEANDPFVDGTSPKVADKYILSPDLADAPKAKRIKTTRKVRWTPAMDHHLWMTYMQYIADPRLTPFKMLPGTAPPLGVCSRVAGKAKRTWIPHRAMSPTLDGAIGLETVDEVEASKREGTPDTIRPEKDTRQPQWPRSEGTTRRRLKELCKRKPSLHAHYQRLLRTRSPSPFTSSSTPGPRSSEMVPEPSFSSRDLNLSLVAATAPSMQPGGPLARLASDEDPPRPQSQREDRPAGWFTRIGRSQAHQKSLSLHSGLSLASSKPSAHNFPSSFDVDRAHLLQSMTTTKSLGRTEFPKNGKIPSLDAPVEFTAASTLPRSLKRRFKSDEEKPKRPSISGLFHPAGGETVIVRNRGFTVGAVHATGTLSQLFEPSRAPMQDQVMTEAPAADQDPFRCSGGPSLPLNHHTAPRRLAEPVPRLGSPFIEGTPARPHNTFPRSYVPSASNPNPFQQRLHELAGDDVNPHSQSR